jgi:sulfur transfer protein SufE
MKDFAFCAKISVDDQSRAVMMKGNQLPLINNSSTTAHKMQGCTLKQLAIFEHLHRQNWMYVVLSRVCTMNGLFFAVPLSEDLSKYSMPDKMKEMIAGFQVRLGLTVYSDAEYQNQL